MAYKDEFQSNNADLQNILSAINSLRGGITVTSSSFVPTNSRKNTYKSKFNDNNIDLQKLLEIALSLPIPVTITYNANGGAFTNDNVNIIEYAGYESTDTGKIMIKSILSGIEGMPTRDNYEFGGWYLDAACSDGKELDLNNANANNIIVYAKWIKSIDEALVAALIDFEYTYNIEDDTVTLISWKGTLNGVPSTEIVIPDDNRIIL